MIIDIIALSGLDAYLRDGDKTNLVQSQNHVGKSIKITEGKALQVSDVFLYLESEDFPSIYGRPENAGSKPLFSLRFHKEMFPNYYDDPFANRVHKISGFEDFNRGTRSGLRIMEVDGVPALVSVGTDDNVWISPVYQMGQPIDLNAVTWDLATSKLTPADSFAYSINLLYWSSGQDLDSDAPQTINIASDLRPDDTRHLGGLDQKSIIAYQVVFKAAVKFDTYMDETEYGVVNGESIGRPLIRAINILEKIESRHHYYSMSEIEQAAHYFHFPQLPNPGQSLNLAIDISSILVEYEEITLELIQPAFFKRFEARLGADIRLRPPMIDKQLGD